MKNFNILLFLIRLYKKFVSPLLPASCRFYPTCSSYAYEAIKKYGSVKGSWLALKRLVRCNPLFKGGIDYVP
ncbi:MAG: membrane protein insertion efficiency factor YidD [Spirochaetaceae bacterium]|nr:membrane protein insertion efficiency factor YidD [Spirochaetaceae bacterium]